MRNILRKAVLSSLLLICMTATYSECSQFDKLYQKGEQAFNSLDYASAAENFSEALKCAPSDLHARFRYGQSLFLMNKYKESSKEFETILKNSPGNISARMFYSESLINLGKINEAVPQLEWILKVQPDNERAKVVLQKIKNNANFEPEKISSKNIPVDEVKIDKELVYSKDSNKIKEVSTSKSESKNTFKNSEVAAETCDNFKVIYVEARPASILPIEYQANSEEERFMNYPAENAVSETQKIINKSNKVVSANYVARTNTDKISARNRALEVIPPEIRAQIEAEAKAKAYRKKTAEKVASSVYTTAEAFAKDNSGSYVVNLERARYFMEKGDLSKANKCLISSEQLAYDSQNSTALLEVRVFKGLMYIYNLDYKSFGYHIMSLKSSLKPENYQAYLDIYNQGISAKDDVEKARMAAGVAIGAGHFAVAADLLKTAFEKHPDDPVLGRLLSDSQLQSRQFKAAEATLKKLTQEHPEDAEAYYNLARFYITADFQPEKARTYAERASELSSDDPKCGIVLGLVDFTEGKVEDGLERIKSLIPSLQDNSLKMICERIIVEGERNSQADFASMLALPGSKKASEQSYRLFGEESLKKGMYFSAFECYEQIGDKAEIGRTCMSLASAMGNAGETSYANKTSEIGLTLLSEALKNDPNNSRANLYLALYQFDKGNIELAKAAIDRGLKGNPDVQTKSRLASVQRAIESSQG